MYIQIGDIVEYRCKEEDIVFEGEVRDIFPHYGVIDYETELERPMGLLTLYDCNLHCLVSVPASKTKLIKRKKRRYTRSIYVQTEWKLFK